jgi:hypothetical protein
MGVYPSSPALSSRKCTVVITNRPQMDSVVTASVSRQNHSLHRSHSQALTLCLDLDPLSPRSPICHRPLPTPLLLPSSSSSPAQPTPGAARHPSSRAIGCSDHGPPAHIPTLLCILLHALHRSLFAPCVIRLPLHRRAYRHSCVCVRTPSISI